MKTLEQIEVEIKQTNEHLEDVAFMAFVKDKHTELMARVDKATNDLKCLEKTKVQKTLAVYREQFDGFCPEHCSTYKEYYMDKVTIK